MKKATLLISLAVFIMSLAVGCANNGENTELTGAANVTDEIESPSVEPEADAEYQENNNSPVETVSNDNLQEGEYIFDDGMDVQFTSRKSDPDFDAFVDMLWGSPESYVDKAVTINGEYMGWFDDYSDRYNHYIFKWDEMGCCPLMMEIRLNDDFSPDDFPKDDSRIEITGVYRSYQEEGFNWDYYYVDVESIFVLEGGAS